MHPESSAMLMSFLNTNKIIEKIKQQGEEDKPFTILEVGSRNVNGTNKPNLLELGGNVTYTGIDIIAGDCVDLVLPDPYKYPFEDGTYDLVISTQTFEHTEFFWDIFKEMNRVAKPDGNIILIHPCFGYQIHRFPVDCWRFLPDGYIALAKYTNMYVIDMRLEKDHAGSRDLGAVFSKTQVVDHFEFLREFYPRIMKDEVPVENPLA